MFTAPIIHKFHKTWSMKLPESPVGLFPEDWSLGSIFSAVAKVRLRYHHAAKNSLKVKFLSEFGAK